MSGMYGLIHRLFTTVLAVSVSYGAATACAADLRGTGDLGLVVERASGSIRLLDTTRKSLLQRIEGLGDLSHASAVFSRDARFAYVFGRDGGLTKVDLLTGTIVKRVIQSGNSIGGAISQDGRYIAAANYHSPGGVKIFDADTLDLVVSIPAYSDALKPLSPNDPPPTAKVVGLEDGANNIFAFSLFEAGEIWVADLSENPKNPKITKFKNIGREPYDALVSPDGRWYIAGLFGEDGVAVLDLWNLDKGVRRALPNYGQGQEKLPVYKMPHLETWAVSGNLAFIPGVGRHEVVIVNMESWEQVGSIPVAGQPVFVMARPDGRQLWVNFAFPNYDTVQVIDVPTRKIVQTMKPGKAVLHMEFTPRGEHVWISVRDENRMDIYDTNTLKKLGELPAQSPSGIFFTYRAHKFGL